VSDDARKHPPTARRLERLRQAGEAPQSAAVAGVVALGAATGLGLLWGPTLTRVLGQTLAEGLRQTATEPSLSDLLGRRLLLAGTVVLGLAVALALVATVAQALQTGGVLRPPRLIGRSQVLQSDPVAALLALLALGGAGVIVAQVLQRYAAAKTWAELDSPATVGAGWLRQLCLLGGLAVLHLLWQRARHQRRAMMTDRERREEQRETQGSWLRQRLGQRRMR
jgi:flagellar biosynthesis protein FlhB